MPKNEHLKASVHALRYRHSMHAFPRLTRPDISSVIWGFNSDAWCAPLASLYDKKYRKRQRGKEKKFSSVNR